MRKFIYFLLFFFLSNSIAAQNFLWKGGDKVAYAKAVYGTQNVADAANTPGIRNGASLWIDNTGNLWLFGGRGRDLTTYTGGNLNDLWKYDVTTDQWTWIKGSSTLSEPGTYGTLNVEATSNTPGSRQNAVQWTDASGNLWLFGGNGKADLSLLGSGPLNDLWMFNITTSNWVWKGGTAVANNGGSFGTQGVESPSNLPPNRSDAASWVDNTGNVWILGGISTSSCGGGCFQSDNRNDLWRYNTSSGQWTWMKGLSTVGGAVTTGTFGVAEPSNTPGGISGARGWADGAGNLWLFGGYMNTANSSVFGFTSYVWKYNISTNNWTCIRGNINNLGVYGTQGTAAGGNTPGARSNFSSMKDNAGNFWVYGGDAFPETGSFTGYTNDLWRYNPSTNQWTWIKGVKSISPASTLGTQGVAASGNTPGGRYDAPGIGNSSGLLFLVSGYGFDNSGFEGPMNDVWKFDIASSNWAWLKGSPSFQQGGSYGTQGISSVANKPGVRQFSNGWIDNNNNIWLFGGLGNDVNAVGARTNDLWKYSVASGEWTWVKGDNTFGQLGIYGTQGVEAAGNKPGVRSSHATWTGNDNNFYMLGGIGLGESGGVLRLNDLWRYNPSTNNWTWLKGSKTGGVFGTYGIIGVPATGNTPGVRERAVTWKDNNGNLWLFGGTGLGASGGVGSLSDLWKYDITTNNWTWIKGSNAVNQFGIYGSQTVPDINNLPGAREGAANWIDNNGNLWLLGGFGLGVSGVAGYLMDLWKYDITTNTWTWMRGLNTVDNSTIYGTLGVQGSTARPGGRFFASAYKATNGSLWLFGGFGFNGTGNSGSLNDLWRYDIATNEWTWMRGSQAIDNLAFHGTAGVEASNVTPSGRYGMFMSLDNTGNPWFFGGTGKNVTSLEAKIIRLNDWWRINMAAFLPVTWKSFSAQKINNAALLKWETENETDNDHFDIERSADGRNFEKIGSLPARVNALSQGNYSFTDLTPIKGINYYRLKQYDKDAKYEYSKIIRLDFNSRYSISISPNPAKDIIRITGAGDFHSIQLTDARGQLVQSMKGSSLIQFNTTRLPAGIYWIRLTGNGAVQSFKIIKQ